MSSPRLSATVILAVMFADCGLSEVVAQPSVPVSSTSAGETVTIVLHAASTVSQSVVTIRDIASIHDGPAWLRERIAGLDVAEFPRFGRAVAVSRDQVAYRIQIAGIASKNVRVDGPAQALVK